MHKRQKTGKKKVDAKIQNINHSYICIHIQTTADPVNVYNTPKKC